MKSIELDPKHPGINDSAYIQRRTDFYHLALQHRLQQLEPPLVDYSQAEHAIWHHINSRLEQIHQEKACSIYLQGKADLGLELNHLPQLYELNKRLQASHRVGIVPAEGLIDTREFFAYLANRVMPCTQFLRHGADPEYTPEPDIVHDVLGHLPPLMNSDYAELMQLIGLGAKNASEQDLIRFGRLYWFAIEFGLIVENDQLKVFGAGLLSSCGEMEFCFSDQVQHKPFDLEEVMATDYDSTQMQRTLFYISSFDALKKEIKKLLK